MKLSKDFFIDPEDTDAPLESGIFKPGDLVSLKGMSRKGQNSKVPVGLILKQFGLGMYKVRWSNEALAKRWALSDMVEGKKIELINR